ncbi:C40 family peptidase [uncultured Clostridium sp.]|uniref:C40 family peptidase n=1 Tax=uncultured Clostridium sp. TaxID=59620 RepID=UPI0025D921FD|nr:C40 family peptidase [uncultured Clostridium sp.]
MQKKKLKKIIAISGVVGTILSVKTIPVSATEVNSGIEVVSISKGQVVNVTSTLRIRESASTNSSVLGTMRNGSTFDIISKSGSWYQIKYNGIIGYVHGDYVKEIAASSSISTKGKVYNVSTNLRVRSGASTSSSILGYLNNNTEVNIVGSEGEWYKIQYNSGYGYVSKEYITTNLNSTNNTGNSGSSEVEVNKTGYVYNVSSGGLRVRKEPSTSSTVLGTLYSGNSVNIVGETGSWYKIKYNSSYAYVHKDYITETKPSSGSSSNTGNSSSTTDSNNSSQTMNAVGIVTNVSSNLRVRKQPSSDAVVLGYLLNNESVNITGKEGNWYKINFKGSVGYVSADYIKISTGSDNTSGSNSSTGSNSNNSVSNAYNIVLEELKSHIGSPYAYGGSGELVTNASIQTLKNRFPDYASAGKYDTLYQYVDSGVRMFDCSGLMQWGFSKANISIGRTTYDQIKSGVEVSLDSVQPGDLLFYSDLGHVGMYIGNGQWIESPNSGKTIRITNVPWSSIGRARRVL